MSEMMKIKCGLCSYEFEHTARICQGCQGSIVHGATDQEISNAHNGGLIIWGFASALLVYGLPAFINSQFDSNISIAFGLGFWGLFPVGLAALLGGHKEKERERGSKCGQIRTFRKDK